MVCTVFFYAVRGGETKGKMGGGDLSTHQTRLFCKFE